MARCTHVKKSRKKIPESRCGIPGGIPKGSEYYWWKFRRGGMHYSLTPPKRSQLTQSAFFATVYNIEDVKEALEELKDEAQGNLENLPQGLQENHMLNERIENLESAISELDGIDVPDDEASEEDFENAIEEVSNAMGNLS